MHRLRYMEYWPLEYWRTVRSRSLSAPRLAHTQAPPLLKGSCPPTRSMRINLDRARVEQGPANGGARHLLPEEVGTPTPTGASLRHQPAATLGEVAPSRPPEWRLPRAHRASPCANYPPRSVPATQPATDRLPPFHPGPKRRSSDLPVRRGRTACLRSRATARRLLQATGEPTR